MSFEIKKFLWYTDNKKSDKVWGVVSIQNTKYIFWGSRPKDDGKKALRFKESDDEWALEKLINSKLNKGYEDYTAGYSVVYDDFDQQMSNQLMLAKLTDRIM